MDRLYHRAWSGLHLPSCIKNIALGLAPLTSGFALAAPETSTTRFNTAFIQGSDQPADLQEFLRGNSVLPGIYRVDIYVNRSLTGRRDIEFKPRSGSDQVEACLTLAVLNELGVDVERLNGEKPQSGDTAEHCVELSALVAQATVLYRPDELRLDLSVPQIAMRRSARGYVSPSLWEEGVSSGFVNYSFNGNRRRADDETTDSYYLGLRNGINLGAWRLRNESSLVYHSEQSTHFDSNRSFAQRDLTELKSQLTLGETYSEGQIFDSVRFRGLQLASDEGMLPDSERVYAPVVRGVAESNATVEVRQNGYLLYSANVAPGPFAISDIYPSGSNGDLEVSVIEADGRRRLFTQAYSSLPIMVPHGSLRYSATLGQYDRLDHGYEQPTFTSGSLVYGLTDRVSGFSGLQLAEDYRAANVGAGVNTGVGAVSVDLTQSRSVQPDAEHTGQSVRVRYANTLSTTGTTLAIAGYRYSSEGFRSFDQHVEQLAEGRLGIEGRARDRVDLNITQAFIEQQSTLIFTATEQRYWNLPGKSRQLFASYNGLWRRLSYSLALDRSESFDSLGGSETDHRVTLSLSLPLGMEANSSRVFVNTTRDRQGDSSAQLGVNGQVFNPETFYAAEINRDESAHRSGSARLSSTTSVGRFDVGYGEGNDYRAWSVGAGGSVVAHGGGINFGQSLGDTFALVEVPGVSGVGFNSYAGVRTGGNGYAVLPYVQPYRANWIGLDTRQLGADIEIANASAQVVPRRGASTKVRFDTVSGRRVQFDLRRPDGSKLPLGASVQDASGKVLAVVDPSSQALVLSEQEHGVLSVKWSGQSCSVAFDLPEKTPAKAYDQVQGVCR